MKALSALFLTLVATGNLAAQEGPLLSASLAAPDTLRLGDRLALTISIDHDPADSVIWPDTLDLGVFELVDNSASEHITEDGRRVAEGTLVLTAFELGDLEIPAIPVRVLRADGTEETVSTNPVNLTIESNGLDESGEIRTIKPPMGIARNWWLLAPWVLLALVLLAVAVWAYRRRQNRQIETSTPAAPSRPAHELAYEALAILEKSDLLTKHEIKQFHIKVSEIARTYVRGRWDVDAIDMTTYDILEALVGIDLPGGDFERLRDLLNRSDMVKFAKYRPTAERSVELIGMTKAFVDSTRRRNENVEAA
jgi:hypothetical protein